MDFSRATWFYHLSLQRPFFCVLCMNHMCLHVKIQTLGHLEGVVSVQTINRRVKNQ